MMLPTVRDGTYSTNAPVQEPLSVPLEDEPAKESM
jgi:hypothetical protein